MSKSPTDLQRIEIALDTASAVLLDFTPGRIASTRKKGGDPVTEADIAVDDALRSVLLTDSEGWLSEETTDSLDRLDRSRVWIVDPIDGTREFIEGIPEWCISIGLAVDGLPVAGGIMNPASGERIVGDVTSPLRYEGPREPARSRSIETAEILASRSEVRRGEWTRFAYQGLKIVPMGSVAYKLALVAAGRADATWTLTPKREWDVAAGVALLRSAGAYQGRIDDAPLLFNTKNRCSLVSLRHIGISQMPWKASSPSDRRVTDPEPRPASMKCGDRGTHNATENDVYIALPHASVPRAIRIARVIPPNRRSERLVLTQLRWTGRPGPQLLPISLRYWKRNVETDVDCRNCDNANH